MVEPASTDIPNPVKVMGAGIKLIVYIYLVLIVNNQIVYIS